MALDYKGRTVPSAEEFDLFTYHFIKEKAAQTQAALSINLPANQIGLQSIFASPHHLKEYFSNPMVQSYLARPGAEVVFDAVSGQPKKSFYEDEVYDALHTRQILDVPYRTKSIQKNFYTSGIGVDNIRYAYGALQDYLQQSPNLKANVAFVPELTPIEEAGELLRALQNDCNPKNTDLSLLKESIGRSKTTHPYTIIAVPATRTRNVTHIFPVIAIYDNRTQKVNAVYCLDSVMQDSLYKKATTIKYALTAIQHCDDPHSAHHYPVAEPIGLNFQLRSDDDKNCSMYTAEIIAAGINYLMQGSNLEKFADPKFVSSTRAREALSDGIKQEMKHFFESNEQGRPEPAPQEQIKSIMLKMRWDIGSSRLIDFFSGVEKGRENAR